jgi:gag-polyprotein putative aspartyl protease
MPLSEALDPLGQRLRTPAERRVHRRFASAHRLLAGHDAFGQGILGEVRAQACHSVGEPAHVDAHERPLFCPGQLFFTALHGSRSGARRGEDVQSTIADGSTHTEASIVINSMTIGGHVLSNVPAAVVPNGAEMLLGFNVLNRVSGKFAINVANSTLDFD